MESDPEQTSEGKAVVAVLAAVLDRLVNSNAHVPGGENITKFHALKAPGISIKQYLERIHKYASCSSQCFILALIYIDRLIQRNNFILSELNVHRVVITAILLAAKFFDDAYYNNAYYAKVGGVLVSEMNGLEVEFLFRINFSLHVTLEVFLKYQEELVSHAIGAGLERPTTEMSLPACVQPPAPMPAPVAAPMHVPVPMHVPTPPFNSHLNMNVMEQQRGRQQQVHQQATWSNTNNTNHTKANDYQRHITPSPPHQQHPKDMESDSCPSQYMASPANSAPDMWHRSNLSSQQPDVGGGHVNPRPRHNSFPMVGTNSASQQYPQNHQTSIPIPFEDMQVTVNANANSQQSKNKRMHSPVDVPCSHFGRQLSPGTSPHFMTAARGVYQR
jgi:hypothetical protein